MSEKDSNETSEIVNESTPTNEPEPNDEPSLHHAEGEDGGDEGTQGSSIEAAIEPLRERIESLERRLDELTGDAPEDVDSGEA